MRISSMFLKISLLVFLILIVLASVFFDQKLQQTYQQLADKLVSDLEYEEKVIKDNGITNAFFISDSKEMRSALINNDRELAINTLQALSDKFKNSTRIKDLKTHIHTANIRSFVRSWKLDKYGDELGGFRNSIVKVKMTEQPVFTYEVGRMGLTLRSIVPIMDNENYIGSLEFIEDFRNASKNFMRRGDEHLLLMDKSFLNIATDLEKAPDIGPYKLSLEAINETFLDAAKTIDFKKLQKEKFIITDQYLITFKTIKDLDNKDVGIHLIASPITKVNAAVASAKSSFIVIVGIFIGSFLILLSFFLLIKIDFFRKNVNH